MKKDIKDIRHQSGAGKCSLILTWLILITLHIFVCSLPGCYFVEVSLCLCSFVCLGFYLKGSLLLLKILCHVISASDKTDKLSIFAGLKGLNPTKFVSSLNGQLIVGSLLQTPSDSRMTRVSRLNGYPSFIFNQL